MRKVLLVALVALAATVSGNVFSSLNASDFGKITLQLEQSPVESKVVYDLLVYLERERGYDYNDLAQQYDNGTLTVDYHNSVYSVTFLLESGSTHIETIEDYF